MGEGSGDSRRRRGRLPRLRALRERDADRLRRRAAQRRLLLVGEQPRDVPDTAHIAAACRPWLAAELAAVRPRVVVAMGAVAAASLLAPGFRVTQSRGVPLPWPPESGPFAGSSVPVEFAVATVHPSSVLRGDPAQREELLNGLVADLRVAYGLVAGNARPELRSFFLVPPGVLRQTSNSEPGSVRFTTR